MYSQYYYDESSPSCLRWAEDRWAGVNKAILCAVKDSVAGYLNPDGYWRHSIGRSKYRKGHLIIWEIFNGEIKEGFVVDHINRDTTDNRISNLRLIDRNLSARNKGKPKNNTSGVVGVKLNSKRWKGGVLHYWMAKVKTLDGKEKVKHFSIKKLGCDQAFTLACDWRNDEIQKLNKLGAGYTESHGK